MWGEIIYPFPNFSSATVDVWEWISNFLQLFTRHVITYSWVLTPMQVSARLMYCPPPTMPILETHLDMKWKLTLTHCSLTDGVIESVNHYTDVIMGAIASLITSLTSVYSTVHSVADQGKHQSSASPAFVWWIRRTNGQLCGKCFHLMTSSCNFKA